MNLKFLMISGISLSSPLQSARQKSLKSGGGREDGNRLQTQCRQHGGHWSGTAAERQKKQCRGGARTGRQNPPQGGWAQQPRVKKPADNALLIQLAIQVI